MFDLPKNYCFQELRISIGKNGRDFVLSNNNAQKIVNDYLNCYKMLVYKKDVPCSIKKEDILLYAKEYNKLLENYETSSTRDWFLFNTLYCPVRLYWKARDYIDHNFNK